MPFSLTVNLTSEYGWYGESIILAILSLPALRRYILYVDACPITFPPAGLVGSPKNVWCRLNLVCNNDGHVVNLSDLYQLVHNAVEARCLSANAAASKLGTVERNDAINYYHFGLKVVDVFAHRLDY